MRSGSTWQISAKDSNTSVDHARPGHSTPQPTRRNNVPERPLSIHPRTKCVVSAAYTLNILATTRIHGGDLMLRHFVKQHEVGTYNSLTMTGLNKKDLFIKNISCSAKDKNFSAITNHAA